MQMMYNTVVQDSDNELVACGDLLLESIYLESDVTLLHLSETSAMEIFPCCSLVFEGW